MVSPAPKNQKLWAASSVPVSTVRVPLLVNDPEQRIVVPAGTVSVCDALIVTFAKFRFTGGEALQSTLAATVRSPALPSPPKNPTCWQATLPFAFTARIALPAGQLPATRFCLLFTAAAVALKFAFMSDAEAGVPRTKVLGMVRSADHASEEHRSRAAGLHAAKKSRRCIAFSLSQQERGVGRD